MFLNGVVIGRNPDLHEHAQKTGSKDRRGVNRCGKWLPASGIQTTIVHQGLETVDEIDEGTVDTLLNAEATGSSLSVMS